MRSLNKKFRKIIFKKSDLNEPFFFGNIGKSFMGYFRSIVKNARRTFNLIGIRIGLRQNSVHRHQQQQ